MVHCALPPWRLVFLEQGCKRSDLSCPGFGGGELGRRSWSFKFVVDVAGYEG